MIARAGSSRSGLRPWPNARLAELPAARPRAAQHLVRFHGVLAGDARWRPLIVPASPQPGSIIKGRRRIDWQTLMRRVFASQLLHCVCGGTRRVIAVIERGPVATRILKHLGLPWELPRLEPARNDQGDLYPHDCHRQSVRVAHPTGPPPDDGEPPPVDLVDQRSAFAAEGELLRADMQCMSL